MDTSSAIWRTPDVQAAVRSGNPGAIVRSVRRANHLTLADLAERCGYSISTLSRMERGKQHLGDVVALRRLADALLIPPVLLGLADTPPRSVQVGRPAAIVGGILPPVEEELDPMRRRTLLAGLAGTAALGTSASALPPTSLPTPAVIDPIGALEHLVLSSPTAGVPSDLSQVHSQLAAARTVFQEGRYADVAAYLCRLIPTAHATRHQATHNITAVADGLLADLYTLTAELMVKLGNDPLAWTTADRATQAAHHTADPLTQAAATRTWAIVLRRSGHAHTAQSLIVGTAEALQPDLHQGPDHLSVYGALLITAAYTAAVDGDRSGAHTLINEAVDAARRLGADANHRHTAFGPTNVGLYQISIARVLGDFGTAIETARHIDPRAIPVAERRARFWSDIARSFHQWDKPEQCYRSLLAAEKASPDETRYRKPVQHITTSLLRHPTAKNMPGLHDFARRNGTLAHN